MNHEICGLEQLHVHSSEGSILDGAGTTRQYAERAKKNNQQYLTITDHGSMSAIPAQLRASDAFKLKPIFGVELYIQPNHDPKTFDLLSKEEKKSIRKSYHLLAIAYNNVGYSNLVAMSNWSWMNGFYYKNRINHEILNKHKEGIIFTSCCINSEIGQAFVDHGEEVAEEKIKQYMGFFGDKFYLEIMLLDFDKQKPYDAFLIKMHAKYGIPVVVTQDCHYPNPQDWVIQQDLLLIQTGRTKAEIEKLQDEDGGNFIELQDRNLWLKSEDELNSFWENTEYRNIIDYELFKQAKKNTVKICELASNVKIDRSIKLPYVKDADEILQEEIKKGFKLRKLPNNEIYRKRVAEEYDLIYRKGFQSYLLIEQKIILEARRYCQDILGYPASNPVGPGRGSAASSLLLYILGITQIDPIKHDLLFSRFLSESRGRQIDYKFDGF